MKILFGIPDRMHRELADLEIKGISELGHTSDTIHFGSLSSSSNAIKKIRTTYNNAIKIRKRIIANKFDLLFLNTAFDFNAIIRDVITIFILKNSEIKVFLKLHGSDLQLLANLNLWQKILVNYLFKKVDGVGVLSSEERNEFIRLKYPSNKIFIVKNPINPDIYIKNTSFKKELGINADAFIFLFCARFIKEKGLIDVLLALNKVVKQFENVHLIAVGDGYEMGNAKNFVRDYKLDRFVIFTGFIPEKEIVTYYSNANALVFPTYHQEGFPMVVFQSLAAGIPVITTQIRASADYLREPENVLWVEAKNTQSIVNAMLRLINDKDLTIKMGQNNKKLSVNFTTEMNASEYVGIFEKILSINGK